MYDKKCRSGQGVPRPNSSCPILRTKPFSWTFPWEAFIDQDFTRDIKKLEEGLNYVKASWWNGDLRRHCRFGRLPVRHNAKQPKQVLLIITDGDDNASSSTLEETIQALCRNWMARPSTGVGLLFGPDEDKRESRHAKRVLETLASRRAASPISHAGLKMWTAWQRRSPTTSGSSTPLRTRPPSPRGWVGIAPFMWKRAKKATASWP